MAPIPAPSPTGITGYSAPYSAAGGGNQYQASGACSGTAWTHTQDLAIFYEVVRIPQATGTFPPGTSDVSALKLTVMGNAENDYGFFSTSSVSGASGCSTAANARQAHIMSYSATDGNAGLGFKGAMYTLSGGYERRWYQQGDTRGSDNRTYINGLFEIDGLPTGWNTNVTLSNVVASQIIARVCNGGVRYNNGGVVPPLVASAWQLMDFSLIDV